MPRGIGGSIQRVMHFFMPKEEEFFGLFAQMSNEAHKAALLLQTMLQEYPGGEVTPAQIEEVEHGADKLRRECIHRLNETFVTPILFDRTDILQLTDTLDDVVDYTKAVSDRMNLYEVASVPPAAHKLAELLVAATDALREVCGRLEQVKPGEIDFVHRVNALENQGDDVLRQGLADLFHSDVGPIEVLKWKEIYDYLEEALDQCESTANAIEAALVKNS